ncbi:MAG: sulfurtransferase [Salinarimonadaceae bacterium]|nr:MAG: sulfurtransferase [Salinarimonadaceae bacterium]
MKLILSTFAAGIVFAGAAIHGAAAETSRLAPLLSAAELVSVQATEQPLLLDIRQGQDSDGRSLYAAGHVPGSVEAPYALWRGPPDDAGRMHDEAELTRLFRSLGVETDRPVVVIHQGRNESDFGSAARVYWTLKTGGVKHLSILNGGVAAWVADGRPLSTEATAPVPSDITVTIDPTWLATRELVLSVVEGEADATLIDARPEAFYRGETAAPAAARPGTLPHAKIFTHSRWFDSGPAIVNASAARRLVEENGLDNGDTIVSFCNTGHWAATNWFALSELGGIDNVKLYPESMVAWSQAGLPMENVPGVFQNLWRSVSSWF